MNSSWRIVGLLLAVTLFVCICCTAADIASVDQADNSGDHSLSGNAGASQADRYDPSGVCSTCNNAKTSAGAGSGTDWDASAMQAGLQSKTSPGGRGTTNCRLIGDELICTVDMDPELDFYQPCDGGDNSIVFTITVSGLENLSVQQAKLVLRQWDVDIPGISSCGPEVDRVSFNGHSLGTLHGADNQWSTNTFTIDPTWVTPGNNFISISIDSTNSGCWCTMTDWAELTLKVLPGPTIQTIMITPPVPVTGKEITFTPTIKTADGWDILGIVWTLSSKTGTIKTEATLYSSSSKTVEPLKYTPPADGDSYGDRTITASLYCTEKQTNRLTQTDKNVTNFKIFFQKWATTNTVFKDDDSDGKPNWYEYWLKDGAVEGLGDTQYHTGSGYGKYSSASDTITVYPLAATTHYPGTVNVVKTGETFGGPGITGIDCLKEVVVHEKRHQFHKKSLAGPDNDIWQEPNWTYMYHGTLISKHTGDPTPDNLPDTYEDGTTHTNKTIADTFDVAGAKGVPVYKLYGDAELDCMRAANGQKGVPENDWADTGKQSPSKTAGRSDIVRVIPLSTSAKGAGENEVTFTGTAAATGVDTNSNGLYELLRTTANIAANASGTYSLTGAVRNGTGGEITTAFLMADLPAGTSQVIIDFEGTDIYRSGTNGPYNVTLEISDLEGEAQLDNLTFTSPAYTFTQFEGAQIQLTGTYSDTGVDTNSDGSYEYIRLDIGTNVVIPGTYNVIASLYGSNGFITSDSDTITLAAGANTLPLRFDGITIAANGTNGPYQVRDVTITDSEGLVLAYANAPHTTQAYLYTQFLPSGIAFEGTPGSQEIDINLNGLIDYLLVNIGVNVTAPGDYTFSGILVSSNGTVITDAVNTTFLGPGSQQVGLVFDGTAIRDKGLNGPYSLVQLTICNGSGSLAALKNTAFTTGAYLYAQFEGPTVYPNGDYTDKGTDTNSNGYYDTLDVTFNVTAESAGHYAINARLLDPGGSEVEYQEAFVDFTAGQKRSITLSFNGKKCYATRLNGTYTFADLSIYNTAGTGQGYFASTAFTTQTYNFTRFEPTGTVYGKVTSASGWPVRNADVYITGQSHDTTDHEGMYFLSVNADGTYLVVVNPVAAHNLVGNSSSITISGNAQVQKNFTLLSNGAVPPAVSSISPKGGNPGLVPFSISGSHFVTDLTVQMTKSGSPTYSAVVTNMNATSIRGTINLHNAASGSWNVVVINPDGQRGIISNGFTVSKVPMPTVSSVTPLKGYVNSTVLFTLTGTNFQPNATTVAFINSTYGSIPATVSSVTKTKISGGITFPVSATLGKWNIEVTTVDGGTGTKSNAFTLTAWPCPSVSSVIPSTMIKNSTTTLTLAGKDFKPGATTVYFNRTGMTDIPATNIVVASDKKLSANLTLPGGSVEGKWNVVVITPDGGTGMKKDVLTVKPWPKPVISTVMPIKAFTNSTVSFTIGGTNFQNGAAVIFNRSGGSPEILVPSYTILSTKKISGTLMIPSTTPLDKWNIVVVTYDGGMTIKSKAFQIAPWLRPTIATITPISGTNGTPIKFNLTGTNFQSDATTVTFNKTGSADVSATGISVISLTKLSGNVILPETGKWNIVVMTVDGGTATKFNAFTAK